MFKKLSKTFKPLLLLAFFGILSSCGSKKDVVYFQDVGSFETIVDNDSFIPKFKVDDVVSIHISTLNPEASAPFNLYRAPNQGTNEGFSGTVQQVDYLVDQAGEIDFPVIGKLKISGLSPEELRVLLRERLSDYLKNPIINIRLQNFTVTILGEVNRPGTYQINGEEITIMEALGLASDLTIKGQRNNILVIRDFDGTKVYYRIDLTSKKATKSPVYYLTQNDVVYVEPNQSAVTASSLDSRANIAISIASVLITSTVILLTRN
ncbi:polysaccharide biosynthesis/export family protein [Maribacter sp. CXY002]|uniref:polysaccharide biosynthesis/export family protein n=1 Tax=Maribacter luteocoastalis TaxID=3407671 RepID=UPI003B67533B